MKTLDSIEHMLNATGETKSGVSEALGKHRNFLSSTFYKRSEPGASTLAAIAEVMGYKLLLVNDEERIEIDPRIEVNEK